MTRAVIQPTLFGEFEVVAWHFDKTLSVEAKELLGICKGSSDYEKEKSIRLSQRYIVQELMHYYKVNTIHQLIIKIK